MAAAWHAGLPPPVIALFLEEDYEGGPLLSLPQSGALKVPTVLQLTRFLSTIPGCYPW